MKTPLKGQRWKGRKKSERGEEDRMRKYTYPELHDRVWLNRKYWEEELSTYKIADVLGCSGQAVYDALKEFDIPRRTISESTKGDKHPLYGKKSYFKGKKHTDAAKKAMSEKKKGKPSWNTGVSLYKELRDREGLRHLYWDVGMGFRDIAELIGCSIERVHNAFERLDIERMNSNDACKTPKARERNSKAKLKNWNDLEFIKKWNKGRAATPNKLETFVATILDDLYPSTWKYNGNFEEEVMLAGMIPDFINVNGEKKVIEVFGDYWHSDEVIQGHWKRSEFGRKAVYSQLGYGCVVLWENRINAEGMEYIKEEIEE